MFGSSRIVLILGCLGSRPGFNCVDKIFYEFTLIRDFLRSLAEWGEPFHTFLRAKRGLDVSRPEHCLLALGCQRMRVFVADASSP